jgi:hypothetical protein
LQSTVNLDEREKCAFAASSGYRLIVAAYAIGPAFSGGAYTAGGVRPSGPGTRDPLRSQPHKRYTDLCQSYTYLSYDDNLWYDAPALMQYRTAARRLLGSSNRSFSRHFYIFASAHHRHQQWIHFTLKWPLPQTWRPARLNILVS